jgi:serine/threonine protein phosphatase PrpC
MSDATAARASVLTAAGATHPGLQRDNNEDRFHVDAARGLFLVVDGVGGQAAGGEAADLALSMLRARLERETGPVDERVREAIAVANNEILRAAASRPDWKGMACVLTVAVIKDGVATVGHVGDTRLYKLRQGRIDKITRDHSPVGEREDAGELSESEAMRHPRRNEVYRDVGSELHDPGDADFVEISTVPVEADAALLLCSDGLSDLVPAGTISAIASRFAGDPARVVQALIEAANDSGGKDNVTVVFVEGERFRTSMTTPIPVARRSGARSVAVQAAIVAFLLAVVGYALVRAGMVRWPAESVTLPSLTTSGVAVVAEGGSIAAAIAKAGPGTQVMVEPGEYFERLVLKDGVRVVSRVPRGAILRMPVGTPEGEPAVVARDVTGAELAGFQIVGDARTPLGIGVLVERADVALVDLEVLGAMTAAVELGKGAAGSVVGLDVHDNPGAGLVIRSAATSRISHSGFTKNGMSERTSAPVIVEAGARVRLEQNVFTGITPEVFRTLPADAAAAALRENWFPGLGIHVTRPDRRSDGRGSY